MIVLCPPDFKVGEEGEEEGGGGGGGGVSKTNGEVLDPQAAARAELEQLKQRVAELESQLGLRKNRGLKFTVRYMAV